MAEWACEWGWGAGRLGTAAGPLGAGRVGTGDGPTARPRRGVGRRRSGEAPSRERGSGQWGLAASATGEGETGGVAATGEAPSRG